MYILYIFLGIIILIVVWSIGSYAAVAPIETPDYSVLEKKPGFEIRQYEPYIIAETQVSGSYSEATNQGFRIIANYIFVNNTSQTSISMTTPVIEEQSEKIAMTTPVLNTLEADETRVISFVLPSKYTLDTLPQPNNSQVTLTQVEARKVAVLRFTWYPTASRVETKKQQLKKLLTEANIQSTGPVQVARYNPPLSMPLLLRNEIIIPIKQ